MNFARHAFAPLLGLGLGLGLGCTAILNPSDDVSRCDNTDGCDDPGDNRYIAVCLKEDNDVPGVCVAEFVADRSCDVEALANSAPDSALGQLWEEWARSSNYASGCLEPENAGKAGCAPPCVEGLEANEDGVCDVIGGSRPKAVPSEPELLGQDIADQFCRSFFCDSTFVCANKICVPCDDTKAVGQGGCGELHMNGAPSCVYTDPTQLDAQCQAPDSTSENVSFGACSGSMP